MSFYRSSEQVLAVLGTAWRQALAGEEMRERFKGLQIYVHFGLREPDAELWLLADGSVHEGAWAGTPDRPVVVMQMTTDVAHRFWLDQLNVPLATARGEIRARGPVAKIFGLIPLVKPVKALYPGLCAEHGVGRA